MAERNKPKQTMDVLLTLRIPEQLHKEIVKAAESEDRTVSNMVRVLIQRGLRKGG